MNEKVRVSVIYLAASKSVYNSNIEYIQFNAHRKRDDYKPSERPSQH